MRRHKHRVFSLAILLSIPIFATSCATTSEKSASASGEKAGDSHYLACNLHPDSGRSQEKTLSSINYQSRYNLIPWGTPVQISRKSRGSFVLENVLTGEKYRYTMHKSTLKVTDVDAHINNMLVSNESEIKQKVQSLSKADQEGISNGTVAEGMSKEGVLIALCYPPEFVNPNPMNENSWTYWRNKFKKFLVRFDENGKVKNLVGY